MERPLVTGWISVSTPPLATRPGPYQVQYGGPLGLIRLERWDGKNWDVRLNAIFGDRWRGLIEQGR